MAEPEIVEPVISVKGLGKTFYNIGSKDRTEVVKKVILEDFNLDIYPGEIFSIVGGSGAGKSLSIRNILHLPDSYPCTNERRPYMPDKGTVYIFGKDMSKVSEKDLKDIRKRIGYVFQMGALSSSLTVWQNIAQWHQEHCEDGMFAESYGKRLEEYSAGGRAGNAAESWFGRLAKNWTDGRKAKKAAREDVESWLDSIVRESMENVQLDYKDLANKKPSELSGGERKRVAIAKEICHKPEILIGDELTTGLPKGMRSDIAHLLCDLKETYNNTLVVITHDDDTLPIYGGRIAFIDSAHLYLFDDFETFERARADNPAVKKYFDGVRGL